VNAKENANVVFMHFKGGSNYFSSRNEEVVFEGRRD
jgi:hypothetical protein